MKLEDVVNRLVQYLEKHPNLANKEVYLWDEDNQAYVGFNNLLKGHKKGFIEPENMNRNSFGEDEMCYSVSMHNEFYCDNKKKSELEQVILL